MATRVIQWRGEAFRKGLRRATSVGLQRAGVHLQTKAKQLVSVPNSGERRKRTRNTSRGAKGSSYTVYPGSSKPGEPPRLRTGHGLSNIVREHDASIPAARVGIRKNAMYMFWHEIGIKGQRRPWLGMQGALGQNLNTISRLAATGGKREIR